MLVLAVLVPGTLPGLPAIPPTGRRRCASRGQANRQPLASVRGTAAQRRMATPKAILLRAGKASNMASLGRSSSPPENSLGKAIAHFAPAGQTDRAWGRRGCPAKVEADHPARWHLNLFTNTDSRLQEALPVIRMQLANQAICKPVEAICHEIIVKVLAPWLQRDKFDRFCIRSRT